jgi:hypothetical protein
MTQILDVAVYVLGPSVTALAGLVVRLRWQALRDRRRQDTLRALIARLPETSTVDICDTRDDGSQLRMRVVPGLDSLEGHHE